MSERDVRGALLRLLARVAPEADLSELDPREPLQRALDIDSFDFLGLLVAIRDDLGVSVPESDYGRVATLDDLVGYLEQRLQPPR